MAKNTWDYSRAEDPQAVFPRIVQLLDQSQTLDAYNLALEIELPIDKWSEPDKMLLASRLARHLGGAALSVRLACEAYRQRPNLSRFLTSKIYALTGQRRIFTAWQLSNRFKQCESETALEKVDALVCQAQLSLVFRDFENARSFLSEADKIAPESPWVLTEHSRLSAEQGEPLAALRYVDQALAFHPCFRPAVQQKVQYLQTLQRDEEALELLESARHHVQHHGIAVQLLLIYSEQENWSQSLEMIQEARSLAPLADKAFENFCSTKEADARTGLGDWQRAAAQAEKAASVKFYAQLAQTLRSPIPAPRRVKIPVPYVQQQYRACAPATLSAITTFWGRPISQEMLIEDICYDGTTDFAERRWAQNDGWCVKEFKVTWDAARALLNEGIPFIVTTTEIESGHAQALIGYDTVRQSFLMRDPGVRHHTEAAYDEFLKHYEAVGPRGLLLLPQPMASILTKIQLPESDLYDLHYKINCALDNHDRATAENTLQQLQSQAPNHRIYWMGRRALAYYDQNPVLHLEAVDQLRLLFPDDDRLIHDRIGLLRTIGHNQEASQMLRERFTKPNIPAPLWRQFEQDVTTDGTRINFALRLAQRSLKRNPQDITALGAFAVNLWNATHQEQSIAVQRLAASLADKREDVAHNYFQMLIGLGRAQDGLHYLRDRAERLLDRSGEPTLTYAHALDQVQDSHNARKALYAALERRTEDGNLLLYTAQIEAAAGQTDEGLKLLKRASAHTSQGAWLRTAARLYRRAGDYEQSLLHWQEVTASSPLDIEAHREIALLLARRDGKNARARYLESIGTRFPLHLGILQLEITSLKGDDNQRFTKRLADFVRVNPQDAWAQRELALSEQQLGTSQQALERAQFARKIDPYNPDSWLVEAVILEKANRELEAKEHLRRALSLQIDTSSAIQRLLILSETADEKLEILHFVREQIESQKTVASAINTYREAAFSLLPLDELTENLRNIWYHRADRWEAWNALSLQLLALGNFTEAEKIAIGATERFPLLATARHHLGIVQGRQSRWQEAITSFRLALNIEPEWAPPVHSLVDAYQRCDRLAEALELLQWAHRRNPLAPTILGQWAELIWNSGAREEAIQQLQKAVDIDPEYDWGWATLSRWSMAVLQKDLAYQSCLKRAQHLQRDAPAWVRVAQLACGEGQTNEQLQAAYRAQESDPRNTIANEYVAIALSRQGRYDEALKACQPAIYSNRIPATLRGRTAYIQFQLGHIEQALETITAVLESEPYYYRGWEFFTDWKLQEKDLEGALSGAERLIRLNPTSPDGYNVRARIYAQTGRKEEAKIEYQRILALSPGFIPAAWRLFLAQLEDQQLSQAKRTIELLQPHASTAVIVPAKILLATRSQKPEEAFTLLAEAAVLPELDLNALKAAMEAMDKASWRDKLNKRLEYFLKDPALNPLIAAMWVSRCGKQHSWKLLKQFRTIPPQSRVHTEFLEKWLLESNTDGSQFVPLTIIRKCREHASRNSPLWGRIGNILVKNRRNEEAIQWLKDWEARSDVECWMVVNLVLALNALNRQAQGDMVCRRILQRGLKDHSTAYVLTYLTLSCVETKEITQAIHYHHDILFEGSAVAHTGAYIRQLLQTTFDIQETTNRSDRKSRLGEELAKAKLTRGNLQFSKAFLAMERRAIIQMARDAGYVLPTAVARSVQGNPRRKGSVLALIYPLYILFVIATFYATRPSGPVSIPGTKLPSPTTISTDTIPSGNSAKDLIQRADNLQTYNGKPDEIIDCLLRALKLEPNNIDALYLLSTFESRLEHHDKAIQLARQAVSIDPHSEQALSALAYTLAMANRLPEAQIVANQVLELDPANGAALFVAGLSALRNQHFKEAVRNLTWAVQAHPELKPAWVALAASYQQDKQLYRGESEIGQLLQTLPNAEAGWLVLGKLRTQAGDQPGALNAFSKAAALNAQDVDLWNSIGVAQARSKQVDKAETAFHKAIALSPQNAEAWNNLGAAYLQDGSLDKAEDAFKRAHDANPKLTEPMVNLIRTFIKEGRLDLARQTCDSLAAIDPKIADETRAEIP
jgi:cellulose synthase operon protein C